MTASTSFAARGRRIAVEDLQTGDEIRISHRDMTVAEVRETAEGFVVRARAGLSFRIPKGARIRRQHT